MLPPILTTLLPVLLLIQVASAHMAMSDPPARRSPRNPFPVGGIDYDILNPLHGRDQFPCKNAPRGPAVRTYRAGVPVEVTIEGSARHGGGHCQFSLSYDQGKTFVVLRTVLVDCLRTESHYSVPLPASAPGGDVIFAWSWVNAIGNREYYMSCADVQIQGTGNSITGPELLVVNLEGTPRIGEFSWGSDGRDLFEKRPTITVTTHPGAPPSTVQRPSIQGAIPHPPLQQQQQARPPTQPKVSTPPPALSAQAPKAAPVPPRVATPPPFPPTTEMIESEDEFEGEGGWFNSFWGDERKNRSIPQSKSPAAKPVSASIAPSPAEKVNMTGSSGQKLPTATSTDKAAVAARPSPTPSGWFSRWSSGWA